MYGSILISENKICGSRFQHNKTVYKFRIIGTLCQEKKEMKISGIYKIQSRKKPERIYIGSSINIHKRWYYHILELGYGTHANKKIQRHYNKYGKDDLIFSIIIGCDKGDLISTEQYFIDAHNPYFNICKKAGSSAGRDPWNKGKKTGIRNSGNWQKGNIPWAKGRTFKMSDEHKKNIGEASRLAWIRRKEQKLMQDISIN